MENLQQAYDRYDAQLKNLFDMRLNGEIDSETYESKKIQISTLRDDAKNRLEKTDNRLDTWLNDAESDFKWAEEAMTILNSKDLPAKRIMLEKFGTEIVLETTGVHIQLSPLFNLVRRVHKKIEDEKISFEPDSMVTPYSQKSDLDMLSIQMGKVVQEVRTVFERLNDTTIYIPVFSNELVL